MTEQEEAVVAQMLDGKDVPQGLMDLLDSARHYGDKVSAGLWPARELAMMVALYMMERPPVLEPEAEEPEAMTIMKDPPSKPRPLPPSKRAARLKDGKNPPQSVAVATSPDWEVEDPDG